MGAEVFFYTLGDKFISLLYAPFNYPEMFWIIFPLVITLVLLELYFGRYPREDPGYHTALENSVFLLFVAVDLVRFLITNEYNVYKVYIVAGIIIYAITLSVMDFFHKLPRNLAFRTSSKFIISFTAYVCIILVYSDLLHEISLLSVSTLLISIALLFLLFKFTIGFIKTMEPKAHDEVEDFLTNVEKEIEEAAKEAKKEYP